MALPALLLLITYAFVTLGLRAMIHFRQTGSFGLNGPSLDASSMERLGAALLTVTVVTGLIGPIVDLRRVLPRIGALNSRGIESIGLVLMAVSIGATFFAQLTMGRSWRVGVNRSERTELVTDGVYRWVRNPIYTAMMAAAIGLALAVPNVLCWIAAGCMIAGLEIQVRFVEEPWLLRQHGVAFARYRATVGRFLPGLGRVSMRSPAALDSFRSD